MGKSVPLIFIFFRGVKTTNQVRIIYQTMVSWGSLTLGGRGYKGLNFLLGWFIGYFFRGVKTTNQLTNLVLFQNTAMGRAETGSFRSSDQQEMPGEERPWSILQKG